MLCFCFRSEVCGEEDSSTSPGDDQCGLSAYFHGQQQRFAYISLHIDRSLITIIIIIILVALELPASSSVCMLFINANAHLSSGFNAPRLVTIENCMKLTQMIVQGLKESKSPLLQLPHFEEEHLRYCISKKVSHKSLDVHTHTVCNIMCDKDALWSADRGVSHCCFLPPRFFSTRCEPSRTWWVWRTPTDGTCCVSSERRSTTRSWRCWAASLTSPWISNCRVSPKRHTFVFGHSTEKSANFCCCKPSFYQTTTANCITVQREVSFCPWVDCSMFVTVRQTDGVPTQPTCMVE